MPPIALSLRDNAAVLQQYDSAVQSVLTGEANTHAAAFIHQLRSELALPSSMQLSLQAALNHLLSSTASIAHIHARACAVASELTSYRCTVNHAALATHVSATTERPATAASHTRTPLQAHGRPVSCTGRRPSTGAAIASVHDSVQLLHYMQQRRMQACGATRQHTVAAARTRPGTATGKQRTAAAAASMSQCSVSESCHTVDDIITLPFAQSRLMQLEDQLREFAYDHDTRSILMQVLQQDHLEGKPAFHEEWRASPLPAAPLPDTHVHVQYFDYLIYLYHRLQRQPHNADNNFRIIWAAQVHTATQSEQSNPASQQHDDITEGAFNSDTPRPMSRADSSSRIRPARARAHTANNRSKSRSGKVVMPKAVRKGRQPHSSSSEQLLATAELTAAGVGAVDPSLESSPFSPPQLQRTISVASHDSNDDLAVPFEQPPPEQEEYEKAAAGSTQALAAHSHSVEAEHNMSHSASALSLYATDELAVDVDVQIATAPAELCADIIDPPTNEWQNLHYPSHQFLTTYIALHSTRSPALNFNSRRGVLFWLLMEHEIMLRLLCQAIPEQEWDIHARALPEVASIIKQQSAMFGESADVHSHLSSQEANIIVQHVTEPQLRITLTVQDIHQIIAGAFGSVVHDLICPMNQQIYTAARTVDISDHHHSSLTQDTPVTVAQQPFTDWQHAAAPAQVLSFEGYSPLQAVAAGFTLSSFFSSDTAIRDTPTARISGGINNTLHHSTSHQPASQQSTHVNATANRDSSLRPLATRSNQSALHVRAQAIPVDDAEECQFEILQAAVAPDAGLYNQYQQHPHSFDPLTREDTSAQSRHRPHTQAKLVRGFVTRQRLVEGWRRALKPDKSSRARKNVLSAGVVPLMPPTAAVHVQQTMKANGLVQLHSKLQSHTAHPSSAAHCASFPRFQYKTVFAKPVDAHAIVSDGVDDASAHLFIPTANSAFPHAAHTTRQLQSARLRLNRHVHLEAIHRPATVSSEQPSLLVQSMFDEKCNDQRSEGSGIKPVRPQSASVADAAAVLASVTAARHARAECSSAAAPHLRAAASVRAAQSARRSRTATTMQHLLRNVIDKNHHTGTHSDSHVPITATSCYDSHDSAPPPTVIPLRPRTAAHTAPPMTLSWDSDSPAAPFFSGHMGANMSPVGRRRYMKAFVARAARARNDKQVFDVNGCIDIDYYQTHKHNSVDAAPEALTLSGAKYRSECAALSSVRKQGYAATQRSHKAAAVSSVQQEQAHDAVPLATTATAAPSSAAVHSAALISISITQRNPSQSSSKAELGSVIAPSVGEPPSVPQLAGDVAVGAVVAADVGACDLDCHLDAAAVAAAVKSDAQQDAAAADAADVPLIVTGESVEPPMALPEDSVDVDEALQSAITPLLQAALSSSSSSSSSSIGSAGTQHSNSNIATSADADFAIRDDEEAVAV